MDKLTAREIELMDLLSQGFRPCYIAKKFYLEETTVLTHFQHIYDKLGIEPRSNTFNRKTRAIYLFTKFKADKVLKHLKTSKENLLNDINLCMEYFTEENITNE